MSIRDVNRLNFANSVYKQKTASDVIAHLHASTGYPLPDSWCAAIDKGFFTSWPGLTSAVVRKNLPKSMSTHTGICTCNEKVSDLQN